MGDTCDSTDDHGCHDLTQSAAALRSRDVPPGATASVSHLSFLQVKPVVLA